METRVGDIVLIHHQDKPVAFARVEEILADVKPGWWQARLLLLQVPTREVTWILRDAYIDGGEFTMEGDAMRLERLPRPEPAGPAPVVEEAPPAPAKERPAATGQEDEGEKVVDLASRRKRD